MLHHQAGRRYIFGHFGRSVQDVILIRQVERHALEIGHFPVIWQVCHHIGVRFHRYILSGIPHFPVKEIRGVFCTCRFVRPACADKHSHFMPGSKSLYDSPGLLHVLQRCGDG